MKVFALPFKIVHSIENSVGNDTGQATKNSLSDVLQSASVKRLLSQPNLIVKTIPVNSNNKFANNVLGSKTNNVGVSNSKLKLPELSIVPVRDEERSALEDEEEDVHLLPSKTEDKKSEIILFPLKREIKSCGHYEDCETVVCDVIVQQYVENGRVSPILATNIDEDEIDASLGRHCDNERCDALNIDHNRCRRAVVTLTRCDRAMSVCDICGVQLQSWRSRLYHRNCKRKNEYRHNNVSKMDLQRERMRERELQILEQAKFRKTDYSDPGKVIECLRNNDELIVIPRTTPVTRQYDQSSLRQLSIVHPVSGAQSINSVSNVQSSIGVSSICESNRNISGTSLSFSVAPRNTITMNSRNTIMVNSSRNTTVMVNPRNAIVVKPQRTIPIILKSHNAITVKPQNAIISGTLLPVENNASSANRLRIANLPRQQQSYVTSGIGTVATTVAAGNAPIVNSLSFVANVSAPGVASVNPSVVVVTNPPVATTSSSSVATTPAAGSTTTTAATAATTQQPAAAPTVSTVTSGAAPMVRIPIQQQNATAVQPVGNWIVAGSQLIPASSQIQPVFRLMPITNLITPPSLLHRTQGIPKFCIMTVPTTSAVSAATIVPPSSSSAATGSTNVAAKAANSVAIASTAVAAATTVPRVTRAPQLRVREIQPRNDGSYMWLRNKRLSATDEDVLAPPAPMRTRRDETKGIFCKICKRFLKTHWYYKIHISKHQMANEIPDATLVNLAPHYHCFICNVSFGTERDFMKHAFAKHNGRTTKSYRSFRSSSKTAATSSADEASAKTRKRKLASEENERNRADAGCDPGKDVKKGKSEEDALSDANEIEEEMNDGPAQDDVDDDHHDDDDDDDDVRSFEGANALDEQTDREPAAFNDTNKEVDDISFVTIKEEIKSEAEDVPDMSEDEAYYGCPATPPFDSPVTNTCTLCRKYIDSSKSICLNCESANSEFSFESCL